MPQSETKKQDRGLADILFHTHLDHCERCANNPFNMCEMGKSLLQMAATEIMNNNPNALDGLDNFFQIGK